MGTARPLRRRGRARASQLAELDPYRGFGGRITTGKLIRCAHCRSVIKKTEPRLEQPNGPSPLHVGCAEEIAPDVLERAKR